MRVRASVYEWAWCVRKFRIFKVSPVRNESVSNRLITKNFSEVKYVTETRNVISSAS